MKLVFTPIGISAGILAGIVGKKAFEGVWGLIDDEEPPDAKHRRINYGKLAFALALEGAIFRVVRGAADHGSRHGFAKLTGARPGDEAPEPE
jgi:Protein of unknown function (DUF4235)